MTGTALIRPVSAVAWELRSAWARGLRVSVTIDGPDDRRLEGHVRSIAATDAFVVITGRHVPLDRVLAVHRPSLLGDSTAGLDERWSAPIPKAARTLAGQMPLEAL